MQFQISDFAFVLAYDQLWQDLLKKRTSTKRKVWPLKATCFSFASFTSLRLSSDKRTFRLTQQESFGNFYRAFLEQNVAI
jgi:hypothetical protein